MLVNFLVIEEYCYLHNAVGAQIPNAFNLGFEMVRFEPHESFKNGHT